MAAKMQVEYRKWMIARLQERCRFELLSLFNFGETVWEAATTRVEESRTSTNMPSDKIAAEMEGTVASHEKVGEDIRRCDVAKWARQLRALA